MIINVPQGYSARLIAKDSASLGIEALYTDGFSSCNIIICLSEKRITLIHVDIKMHYDVLKIKKEIEWVDKPNEFILLARSESPIRDNITQLFAEYFPDRKLQSKIVTDDYDGVSVSFAKNQENQLHSQISQYPMEIKPDELCRHPQEKRLLAVQKIEQIIGVGFRARHPFNFVSLLQARQCHLFDGNAWEFLDKNHLKVDVPDEQTKYIMNTFDKDNPFITTARLLGEIIDSDNEGTVILEPIADMCLSVAPYIEYYLNDFANEETLFSRNFKDSLDFYEASEKQDKDLKDKLLTLITQKGNVFKEITSAIEEYKLNSRNTIFKEKIVDEYGTFARSYKERHAYTEADIANSKQLQVAKKIASYGALAYQKKDYVNAEVFFKDTLKKMTLCCTKNNTQLAIAYYNLGRSLQQLERFVEAKKYLSYSLTLKKNFTSSKPERLSIEKTEKALADCQEQLALSVNKAPSAFS